MLQYITIYEMYYEEKQCAYSRYVRFYIYMHVDHRLENTSARLTKLHVSLNHVGNDEKKLQISDLQIPHDSSIFITEFYEFLEFLMDETDRRSLQLINTKFGDAVFSSTFSDV